MIMGIYKYKNIEIEGKKPTLINLYCANNDILIFFYNVICEIIKSVASKSSVIS